MFVVRYVRAVCPVIRGIMVAIAVLGVIELPQGWLGRECTLDQLRPLQSDQQGVPLGLEG
jgi:hypothetical protein